MFSLETFLYSAINKASREKDIDKLENLGPYVRALSTIVSGAE